MYWEWIPLGYEKDQQTDSRGGGFNDGIPCGFCGEMYG